MDPAADSLRTLPGRRLRPAGACLLLLAVVSAAACHQLLDDGLGPVRCTQEGAYGPPACPAEQSCRNGWCTAGVAQLGAPCQADGDCLPPSICLDGATIGLAAGSVCSRPCCSSGDCGPAAGGLVCWPAHDGAGRLCWPAAQLDRGWPLGSGPAGAPCEQPEQCRSGVCESGWCVDTCCDDSYCGEAAPRCRLRATDLATGESWACGPDSQGGVGTAECHTHQDCVTGHCLVVDEEHDLRVCARPCCSSTVCGTLTPSTEPTQTVACAVLEDSGNLGCSELLPLAAEGLVGASCSEDDECRSGICAAGGYCSDVCCRDSDCGDESRFSCRPVTAGESWSLQCVRK